VQAFENSLREVQESRLVTHPVAVAV